MVIMIIFMLYIFFTFWLALKVSSVFNFKHYKKKIKNKYLKVNCRDRQRASDSDYVTGVLS